MHSDRRWGLEALEARLLLSADPLTAGLLALAPQADDQITPFNDPPLLLTNQTITSNSLSTTSSLRISGTVELRATTGNLNLGNDSTDYLGGNSSATADFLTLRSDLGDIRIRGAVGDGTAASDPLSGLTLVAGDDITFDREVIVAGNLTIDAGGIVVFEDQLTLLNGGSLTITGATQVIFRGAVELIQGLATTPGNVLIEADEIDLQMGDELFNGTGLLELRAATPGLPTALLSPTGAATGGVLNLEAVEMRAFADGFSLMIIGQSGQGQMSVGAETALDGVSFRDSLVLRGATIDVTDYSDPNAMLRLGAGNLLRMEAAADISIYNEIEADAIQLVSTGGRVVQLDTLTDNRSDEALRTLGLEVSAATGITLDSVETVSLQATNTGAGDIAIEINAARSTTRFDASLITGSVIVLGLSQTAGSGGNDISVVTAAGSLSVAGGIAIAGNGGLTLTAGGAGSDLTLGAPVALVNGPVNLSAADALTTTAAGTITASGPSDIALSAGTGNLALGAAITTNGGSLSLSSGGALDFGGITLAAGPGGEITLESVGDMSIGIVEAAQAITLRSTTGRLIDGLAGDAANLRGEAAAVTLEAVTGIGTGAAALRGTVGTLNATNTGSGGIFFTDETALTVTGASAAGTGGAIVLRALTGTLASTGAVVSSASGGSGHILMEAVAGNLNLGATVQTSGGSISLLAAQALALAGAAFDVRSQGTGQTLDLRAGSTLTMGAEQRLLSANGAVRAEAGGALQLGRIDAGTAGVALQAGGAVTRVAAAGTADVTAASLRIVSAGAIASGATPLSTTATTLALDAAGSAFVAATGNATVGSLPGLAIQRVGSDGGVVALAADTTRSGAASGGTLVLEAMGALDVAQAVTAATHVRLTAGGAISLAAPVTATAGALTLIGGGAVTATAAGDLTAGGALDVQATGAVTLADGQVASAGGAASLVAGGALGLGRLTAVGDAQVTAVSVTGLATSGIDITAPNLRLAATGGDLGGSAAPITLAVTQLAASAAGGAWLNEADALTLTTLAATDSVRVGSDGSLGTTPWAARAGLAAGGSAVLVAAGNVSTTAATTAGGTLHLASGGALTLGATVTAGGAASLAAAQALAINANVSGASLDASAGAALSMASGTSATATGVRLQAGGGLAVATVTATQAALLAGSAITDANADAALNLSAVSLLLQAGGAIGSGTDAIETAAGTLAASAGGGLFLAETDGLTVGTLSLAFQRVAASGAVASLAADGGAGLTSGGALALTAGGDLTVAQPVAAQGPVLLETDGALALQAALSTGGGALSLLSVGAMSFSAAAQVQTAGGALDLLATGAVTMADGASFSTGGGDARVATVGALQLALLDAGSGDASVIAESVTDADGSAGTDLVAQALRLQTLAGNAGSAGDALELAVVRLAAASTGELFLTNTGALTLDTVAPFDLQRVGSDGLVTPLAGDTALAGLAAAQRLVLLNTGSITGDALATVLATGDLRIAAGGAAADLALAAAVRSIGGHLSLAAGRHLTLAVGSTTDAVGKSQVLEAGGDLTLASATANDGEMWISAGGTLALGRAAAGAGGIAVMAAAVTDGDTAVDLIAARARMVVTGAAGAGSDPLEMQVGTLAVAAGSFHGTDDAGLTLGAVVVNASRVGPGAVVESVALPALAGLATTGTAVLVLSSGDLAVASASSTGAARLEAVSGALALNAALAATGPVSLLASGNLALAAAGDITATGAASLDLQAGGNLTMADGAQLVTGSGAVRLAATGTMSLGGIATTGSVSLRASSITDSGTGDLDIDATALGVQTTGTGTTQGFGSGSNAIETRIGTLALDVAGTGAGGVFIAEADGLVVDTVGPVAVSRVGADGTLAEVSDAALSDLASGGNLIIVSATGDLDIREGDADDRGFTATGNVLLEAVAGALRLGGDGVSGSGHVSLLAGGNLLLDADLRIQLSGRNADLQAGGAITAATGTSITTTNSDVRLAAGGALVIDRIAAGTARISLTGASLTEAGSDDAVDLAANGLRIAVTAAIGSEANRLELQVGTLTARAGAGGMWFTEADAVRIGDVTATVKRVGTAGTVTDVVDAVQSDLVTTAGNGDIALTTLNGDIDLLDGTAPADGRSITPNGSGRVLLDVNGAGAALDLTTGEWVQAGPVEIPSDVRLQGSYTINAAGAITIDGAVDGTAGNPADVLTLNAAGPVTITGALGATTPLDGLVITGATDVTIAQPINVRGDVNIQASGIVRLDGPINLTGGTLSITGASQIILGDVVLGSGNLLLVGNQITLNGTLTGAAGATAQFSPVGNGSVAYGGGAGTLAIDGAMLARLSGFGNLVLGSQDSAAVRMAAGSVLDTGGRALTLQAVGDLAVGRVLAGAAGVSLLSSSGTISDAGNDTATDVSAGWLLMRGKGPALAPGASSTVGAIDVEAPRLDLGAASGIVLRDSGTDGRARYNLLDGGVLYQLLEAPASVERDASVAPGSSPAAVTDWLNAVRPLSALRDEGGLELRRGILSAPLGDGGAAPTAAGYLQTLTADPAEAGGWLAQRLERSLLLEGAGPLGEAPLPRAWDESLTL